jgi:hypothetical protein
MLAVLQKLNGVIANMGTIITKMHFPIKVEPNYLPAIFSLKRTLRSTYTAVNVADNSDYLLLIFGF